MDATRGGEPAPMKNRTTAERKSDRELVIRRTFNAPARIVFDAWTKPELLKRWWAPKSTGISFLSCEMDVRAGGAYRRDRRPQGMARGVTRTEVEPKREARSGSAVLPMKQGGAAVTPFATTGANH